jgi:hypothetical protein
MQMPFEMWRTFETYRAVVQPVVQYEPSAAVKQAVTQLKWYMLWEINGYERCRMALRTVARCS